MSDYEVFYATDFYTCTNKHIIHCLCSLYSHQNNAIRYGYAENGTWKTEET